MNTNELKAKILDYVFFIQNHIQTASVMMERNGFRVTNPQTHSHLRVNTDEVKELEYELGRIEDFILMAHDYNEANVKIMTHEEMASKKISMSSYYSQNHGNSLLTSQKERDEYLQTIAELKSKAK